ncbi:MAG: alpha/beta fold hydrolase, partial [Alphaproteobacteria bacterium]
MTFLRNDAGGLIPPFAGEAAPWLGGDLQTMRHFLRRDAPPPPPSREILLDLDDGDRLLAAFHPPTGTSRGCMIAVHGLNGCMDAQHIWWLVPQVLAACYSVLRINMRGAGPARKLARGTYNAGAGADLLPFIDAAAALDPGVPLFMIAHSLGGTAALNMALAFPDQAARLAGLVTIGTPLDMTATARQFSSRRNLLYVSYMLAGLKDIAATAPGLDRHYRD